MKHRPPISQGRLSTSYVLVGVLCCLLFAVFCVSCKKPTPSWDEPGSASSSTSAAISAPTEAPGAPTTAATPTAEQVSSKSEPDPAPDSGSEPSGIRFMAYNVENWLAMDRYVNNKPIPSAPKAEKEKAGVVRMIVHGKPDILGICEIGTVEDMADIQARLKEAGLDLPHAHYTGGSDTVRHLCILSKFPITETHRPVESDFTLDGRPYSINRGILDVTIPIQGAKYRFLGVHFKSKREVEGFDQEEMRIHEAILLRKHVDSILEADPQARIVAYGDFNDTRKSSALEHVTLRYSNPRYLTAIPARDSRGESWTHFWAHQDIYSRIDFIFVSPAMRKHVDFDASHIIDQPYWNEGSDHRPILAIFK